MDYNIERNKCIRDPIYFIEHYVTIDGKNIILNSHQKSHIKKLYEQNRTTQRYFTKNRKKRSHVRRVMLRKYVNGELYHIEDEELEEGNYSSITENEDGTYSYIEEFWNGGTDLVECLERSLSKLSNN